MQTIFLITHCEATHSVEGKVGGWYDSELTERGKKQAQDLAVGLSKLTDLNTLKIYSSDLRRAAQTAELLKKNKQVIKFDERLREMSFGSHEGLSQSEHHQTMVPVDPNVNRLDHRICPGAESRREVAVRMNAFMEELIGHDKDALIVTHGFAATFVIAAFQNIDVNSQGYINYALKPGSILKLKTDDLFENRTVEWIKMVE